MCWHASLLDSTNTIFQATMKYCLLCILIISLLNVASEAQTTPSVKVYTQELVHIFIMRVVNIQEMKLFQIKLVTIVISVTCVLCYYPFKIVSLTNQQLLNVREWSFLLWAREGLLNNIDKKRTLLRIYVHEALLNT